MNRLNAYKLFLAAAVALLCGSSLAGIYSGPIDAAAYSNLLADVETACSALTNQMAEAETLGINTDYARVTRTTLELFKDVFVPWDRVNTSEYYTTAKERNDPVYLAYGADGLVFDELADCLEIASAATDELQQQINGVIVLQNPPDFSTGSLVLNGTHYELDGDKVIPSRIFWQPENNEDIWQAYGRMGGTYYGIHPNLAATNAVQSWSLNGKLIPDVEHLTTNNVGPVEFWHATVVSPTSHWSHVDYPEVYEAGGRFFNHYDIDNPLVQEWETYLFDNVLSPASAVSLSGGGIRSHLLNNEPRFPIRQGNNDSSNNLSAHTYAKFSTWLSNKYTTVTGLNISYGTSYATFSEAATNNYVIDDGVSESLQGGPIWYDWCLFNQERVNDWFDFLNSGVHSADPAGHTHIKIWGGASIHADYQDQGIDYEYLTKLVDLPGSDSQFIPSTLDFDNINNFWNEGWKNRYMFDWRQQSVMMDFTKSISPEKSYQDAEWHGIDGGRWLSFHTEEEYLRAALWMGASHGLSAINTWFWNRDAAGGGARRSASETFNGTFVTQPIVMNAYGRILKEINAHADAFAALVPEVRYYLIYYSNDSAIQDLTYSDEMTDVYEALKLLNVPVGFTTPTQLTNNAPGAAQTLIVPRTEFISDDDLAELESFRSGGGVIILVDPASCFTKDEIGVVRAGHGLTGCPSVCHNEAVYTMAGDLERALAARKPALPVECTVTDTNSMSSYGVLCSQSEDAGTGEKTVMLVNASQDPRVVTLTISGAPPVTVTNLITGQAAANKVTMKPQDVLLVRLAGSGNPIWDGYVGQYGLTGVKTDNCDSDSLTDWGEYIFGGDPTDDTHIGTSPVFEPASGDFSFYVRNDASLIASVLTTTNLLDTGWVTNDMINITAGDGSMGTHITRLGVAEPTLFWKVLVDEIYLTYQLVIGAGGSVGVASSGNGNFEGSTGSGSGYAISLMPHWFNLSGAETKNSGTDEGLGGGPEPGSQGCWLFPAFVLGNDTGYRVQAPGETFHLSIYADNYGNSASYNGDEEVKMLLFTSSDPDGVDADTGLSELTVLDSVQFPVTGSWTNCTAGDVYTTAPRDVGKTVYLGLTIANPSGANVFPRFDVVKMEVNK